MNLLVGEVDIFDAAWWAEQQRLRFFESPMEEDAADEVPPGLEYSSGEDSDMDMGEEVGEAVDMGEGMGEAVVYQLTMVYQLTYTVLALLALLL